MLPRNLSEAAAKHIKSITPPPCGSTRSRDVAEDTETALQANFKKQRLIYSMLVALNRSFSWLVAWWLWGMTLMLLREIDISVKETIILIDALGVRVRLPLERCTSFSVGVL